MSMAFQNFLSIEKENICTLTEVTPENNTRVFPKKCPLCTYEYCETHAVIHSVALSCNLHMGYIWTSIYDLNTHLQSGRLSVVRTSIWDIDVRL